MSELPENTIEVWFDGEARGRVPASQLRLKVGTAAGKVGTVNLADLVALLNPPKPQKAPKEPRRYQGVKPGDDFVQCATLSGEDGDWLLYAQKNTFKGGVRKYKLVTVDPLGAPYKGNYQLYCEQKVIGHGGDFESLENFRPGLFRKFEEWVTANSVR